MVLKQTVMILKTKTGGSWNTDLTAYSNLFMKLNKFGKQHKQRLKILGIAGEHFEFCEIKTDLLIEDEFGIQYEICEDCIWQY
jgi:hypothetical protein